MTFARLMQAGAENGRIGSAFLLAPNLVLTTGHLAGARPMVRTSAESGNWFPAVTFWESPALDVALLRTDRPPTTAPLDAISWTVPVLNSDVRVIGYSASSSADSRQSHPVELRAVIVTVADHLFTMEAEAGNVDEVLLGGAMVMTSAGDLVGMIVSSQAAVMVAVTLRELFNDKTFAGLAGPAQGGPARRWPISALLQPSALGSTPTFEAEATELPFVGRQSELDLLEQWCLSENQAEIGLLLGRGGSGKTRLALELCSRMAAKAWVTGFADPRLAQWQDQIRVDSPTLAVIDYADADPADQVLRALWSRPAGSRIRVLLLSRNDITSNWVTGGSDPVRQLGPVIRLDDHPLPQSELQVLGALIADRLGDASSMSAEEWDKLVPAGSTPLDVHLAVGVLTLGDAPGGRSNTGVKEAFVSRVLSRWHTQLTKPGPGDLTKEMATQSIALILLAKPTPTASIDLLRTFHRNEVVDMTITRRIEVALPGWFNSPVGIAQLQSDSVLGTLLELTPDLPDVVATVFDWVQDYSHYLPPLLRRITILTQDSPSLARTFSTALENTIEEFAKLAASERTDNMRTSLLACISVLSAEVGETTAQRWRTTVRLAAGFAPIGFAGMGDRRARVDRLDRTKLIDVLVELLLPPFTDGPNDDDASGPSVVAIDGPWGAGKTSLMGIVRDRLDATPRPDEPKKWPTRPWRWLGRQWRARRFTVAGAIWLLWRWREKPDAVAVKPSHVVAPVTVWFNPWAHQSSEQVWAGLASAILAATRTRLHHSDNERARYWLRRNAGRLDRGALRRHLFHSIRSPLLKIAFFALWVPLAAAVLRLDQTGKLLVPPEFLLYGAGGLLGLTLVHTLGRLLFGRVAAHSPDGLLDGPVLSGSLAKQSSEPGMRDPLHHARSGFLYLLQHDIRRLLVDAADNGLTVVVFIDDLDRCTPKTTAEVLEAVNLFLSEAFPSTRFVIGLDMAVVAGQIDHGLKEYMPAGLKRHFEDPSPGWTFLRKLIQLPVVLPRIDPSTLNDMVRVILGEAETTDDQRRPTHADVIQPQQEQPGQPATTPTPSRPSSSPAVLPAVTTGPGTEPVLEQAAIARKVTRLEHDPEVRQRIYERLAAAQVASARDTKRLLTVWQFYIRLLAHGDENPSGSVEVERARAAVLLAEIVVRWPALLAGILGPVDNVLGIVGLLEAAPQDDLMWARAIRKIGLDWTKDKSVATALREIMMAPDSKVVLDLVKRLF